ncbi:hypothetical protein LP419_38800 [Massilia sp. H-1]|nr:hypothetical protein LP419_38800 [Massilia sp. H-1]
MFCVALGFGITSAFFISFSSFVGTSVRMVEQNSWDLAVDFVAPVWNENLDAIEKIPGIGASTPYTKGVAQAVRNGVRRNLYIGGFDPSLPWHAVTMVARAAACAPTCRTGFCSNRAPRASWAWRPATR